VTLTANQPTTRGPVGPADRIVAADQPASLARPASHLLAAIDLALKIGMVEAAEQAARALIGRFPEAAAPSVMLGRALVEQGHWRQAIEHFRWVLAIHPLDPAAWTGLATALAVAGQAREARAALSRAALHDPLDSQLLTPGVVALPREGSGVSYLRQGYDALARTELVGAIVRQPDRDDLRLYAIEALRRCNEVAEALTLLDGLTEEVAASFPALLLRAALNPAAGADARGACARIDLDGQLTRRFFAPQRPPWDLLPAPSIVIDELLAPLQPYLPETPSVRKHADGQRASEAREAPALSTDIKDFMSTAERMRVRLVTAAGAQQPLLNYQDSERQVHLMLASRNALSRRFGADGAAVIDRRLRALVDALHQRGIHGQLCYIDDAETLRLSDQAALGVVAYEAAAIAGLARAAGKAIAERGQELATLLLIGGGDCLPLFRLPNPLRDDDPELVSDLLYGAEDEHDLAPNMVIARIPDGGKLDLLLEQIDRMIVRHAGRPRGPLALMSRPRSDPSRMPWTLASGYAAQAWREPSRIVLDALHGAGELTLCPPSEAGGFDTGTFLGSAVAYVNLHGAAGRSSWYGHPEEWAGPASKLPVALRPDQIGGRCALNALLVSEACYGMELDGRTIENSIPLRALQDGAAACVGSTVTAYGSYAAPLIGADLLTERLMVQLAAGASVGVALRQARAEFAQTIYRRQGYLDDVDRKTLLSYVVYGDPWAAVVAGQPTPGPKNVRLSAILRPSRPRATTPLDERQVPRELVAKVRATLRRVLPGAEKVRLAIAARSDRGLALKGDQPPEMVFSAREDVATDDGAVLSQSAHITVSHNTVVKVAVTR
jgi:Tetratricopeptide repeat